MNQRTTKHLSTVLAALDTERARPALMTHVVAGYPTLKESGEIVRAMADNGAAMIELQIPFSDPIADGPTIMAANEAALANGVTVKDCLRLAEQLSRSVRVPLLFMTYFNILYRYHRGNDGVRWFCRDAARAGIQALIVPDVPPEEEHVEHYWETAKACDLLPVPIVSPTTDNKRLAKLAKLASEGFVYCVSTTGTTGARAALPPELKSYTVRVRSAFELPVAVGFGISSPAQVKSLTGVADIAIVGSAMIDQIRKAPKGSGAKMAAKFTAALAGRSGRASGR